MCTKPRCVPPHKFPIATSMNLTAAKCKLHIPHVGIHLPQDKPTRLCSFGWIPAPYNSVSSLKFRSYHPHLSHCISIVNSILKLLPSRCCRILLQYILGRWTFLQSHPHKITFKHTYLKLNQVAGFTEKLTNNPAFLPHKKDNSRKENASKTFILLVQDFTWIRSFIFESKGRT